MVISDNGASAEGGPPGSVNENKFFNNVPDRSEAEPRGARRAGRPEVLQPLLLGLDLRRQHAVPPLEARDLSRRRVSDPFLVHWPKGIKAKGEIRHQFAHAIDMVPTVLECARDRAAGADPRRDAVADRRASASRTPSTTRRRESQHTTQYFEMFAHRSIYHDGWRAVCPFPGPSFTEAGVVFGTPAHRRQAARARRQGLGAVQRRRRSRRDQEPGRRATAAKLIEMIALWYVEAGKYNVLPIDSRGTLRFADERPQLTKDRTDLHLLPAHAGGPGERRGASVLNRAAQHHRRGRDPQGRRRRRADLPRRATLGGYTLLRPGQEAALRPQLRRRPGVPRRRPTQTCRRARSSCASSSSRRASPTSRRARARPAARSCTSTRSSAGEMSLPVTVPLALGHRQRRHRRPQSGLPGQHDLPAAVRVHRHDREGHGGRFRQAHPGHRRGAARPGQGGDGSAVEGRRGSSPNLAQPLRHGGFPPGPSRPL